MEEQHTDRKLLKKGIKHLLITLPLMFIGPVIINSAFKNHAHPLHYPVLFFGIALCITSVYLLFRGLQTIMKSLFGK